MKLHASDMPSLSQEAIREQLDRILSSQGFRGSDRPTRLLRYLVEQTLNGQAERLKEYSIGTEALRRAESFDPRMDPIVRSEVSRLRARLDKYYATEGQADVVDIALPKGSYITRFEHRTIPTKSSPGIVKQPLPRLFRLGAPFAALAVVLIALVSSREFASLHPGAGIGAERSIADSQKSAVSIAVLPFLNLSGDAGQEFFSDGMTEEITTALAKVPDLRVVGRTSAFRFKGANKDLRAIGQALSATHLIEGSVRKEGNRVRIIAQLIKADDGMHVWTEEYDRELTDVFTIQENIAQAITASLMVPLGLQPGQRLISSRDIDPEAYEEYLRGKARMRTRNVADAAVLLEQVVTRDPNYAPAWAQLAQSYALVPAYDPIFQKASVAELRRLADDALPKAEAAARRAIQLDPNNAAAYTGLAMAQSFRGKLLDADQSYTRSLSLDPLDPETLHQYSDFIAMAGKLHEAIAIREQLRALEPLVPVYNSDTDKILLALGDNDKALAMAQSFPPGIGGFRALDLARIYTVMGRYKEAASTVLTIPRDPYSNTPGAMESAAQLLRNAPAPPPPSSRQAIPNLGVLSFVFPYAGMPERALTNEERLASAGYWLFIDVGMWQPDYRQVRTTQRFKHLMRQWSFVDYWRARGWPDLCHPTTGDDFECT